MFIRKRIVHLKRESSIVMGILSETPDKSADGCETGLPLKLFPNLLLTYLLMDDVVESFFVKQRTLLLGGFKFQVRR